MIKNILKELVAIRKELQDIRLILECTYVPHYWEEGEKDENGKWVRREDGFISKLRHNYERPLERLCKVHHIYVKPHDNLAPDHHNNENFYLPEEHAEE